MKLNVDGIARASAYASVCAGALAAAALLGGCGGGSTENSFRATRVIAFGDETSVINADGSKYTINGLASGSTTTLDCNANPLWIQGVAALYGLVFPQCAGTVANPLSRIRATNGATVAELAGQIDQQIGDGGLQAGDLVTVLIGANDVAAQFAQYPAVREDQLIANLDAAGATLARQVNRLADLGAKVVVSTIPDMGLAPFAGNRAAGSSDTNPALVSRLSTRFNDAMLARLTNDGHKIGLVQLDQFLLASNRATAAGQGTFANTTRAACAVALPQCTTNTLVAEAVNVAWMWADDRHLGPVAQANLGSLAASRALNNPF